MMDDKQKSQILLGRDAIDKYRIDHEKLYTMIGISNIPEAHTPLLNTAKSVMTTNQIESLDKFFKLSELLNVQEMGFETIEEFLKKRTEKEGDNFNNMWQ
jgi:hypothetical protein